MSDQPPRLRVAAVGIVALSMFAALFARLYYLQVLDPRTIEEVRGSQVFRPVAYQGPRGRILDRNGKVLVDNRESIVITIDRRQFEAIPSDAQRQDLLARLARTLNQAGVPMKVDDIRARLADKRYDLFKPVPIVEDVTPELEVHLLERSAQFPSVDATRVQLRRYPQGPLAAHVVGYVGAINAEELEAREGAAKRYEPGDEIGKTGVERIFEDDLRGTPGERLIEVDARNVEVGTRSVVAPVAGEDLQLTLDADLQRWVENHLALSLADARARPKRAPTEPDTRAPAGSVVVLDVKTGEVLAVASHPSYDPADFVGGISEFRFAELNDPGAFFPLNDRAVSSAYPPGSTFKLITAYAALRSGIIGPDDAIVDRGVYTIEQCQAEGGAGCQFSNAGRASYGRVDLRRALSVSSDVYFYRLGELFWNNQQRFGPVPIQEAARTFGFGVPTGVQLTDEGSGYIDEPQRRVERHQQNPTAFPNAEWYTGDNVNLAIGQGELLVTPLQLANAYAALANGGTLHSPSVARAVIDHVTGQVERRFDPRVRGRVELAPEQRQAILDGLTRVVTDGEGTASDGFAGFPLDTFGVAGKTGTAEVDPGKKADTALFAAFGPTADPRYAVVAVLEEAGFGADTAVPLVRRVFDYLRDPAANAEEAARVAAAAAALQAPPLPASAPATATPATAPHAEEQNGAGVSDDEASAGGADAGDEGTTAPPDTTPTTAPAPTTSSPPSSAPGPSPAPPSPPPDSTPPAGSGDGTAGPATTTLSAAGPDPPSAGAGGPPPGGA